MTITELLIYILAVWRIASLLQLERGPYGIFARLRRAFGVGHDYNGEPTIWPDTEIGKLIECLACGSIYVGLGLVGLHLLARPVAPYVALPFALSAGATIIEQVVKRLAEGRR